MNAFNRLVLLIVALLLIAVPIVLLLVGFGVIPASILRATGYDGALSGIGGLSEAVFTTIVRAIIAVVGALIALLALLLLLRELTFGRRVSRAAVMDDTPGRETVITASAVRTLAEHAAREAGAVDPSTSLSTDKSGAYNVHSGIKVPESGNFTQVATRTRENVRRALDGQGVPVGNVEVTVQGTAS